MQLRMLWYTKIPMLTCYFSALQYIPQSLDNIEHSLMTSAPKNTLFSEALPSLTAGLNAGRNIDIVLNKA